MGDPVAVAHMVEVVAVTLVVVVVEAVEQANREEMEV
jgi:hypothetical protein